jgi:hypothetical protein
MLQARDDLRSFSDRFEGLTTQFATAFDALQAGKLSQEEFGEGLEKWLLPQWRTLSAELRSHAAEPGSARARADVLLDGVMDSWQRALTGYAHGLHVHDPYEVLGAFAYIGDAEEHQRRAQSQARALERELQRPQR